ncbi:BRCA1 protein, partial [Zapornia atra]|nr:BRCA1 protein [Zapornia atra]
LDTVKEPVSTKCDHVFCRFCMFKLFSKKKRGVTECPLCKTEVTKRSLKENSRFKQLIEGLLETIHAFELDTGVKFLSSYHLPKPSTEASAPELSCKENSVVQSKGFRNRRKSTRENGQENCTLVICFPQFLSTRGRRCSQRNQPQNQHSEKGVYIELGSDSSEELFKQASNTGFQGKEVLPISSLKKPAEPKRAEKWNESSCNTQPDKLGAKEMIQPKVIGEGDLSEEGLSKRRTRSITECAQPGQGNVTEQQSSPSDGALLAEQCDRRGGASPLRNGDTPFFNDTGETDAEQAQCNSEPQEFDLNASSESRLNKSKGIDIVAPSEEAVEVYEPEQDSLCEKELPLEKLLQTETPPCATPNQVSRKRLKRSIQKVNEWFSKSNKILSSSSSQGDSAGTTDASGEGDACLSDKDSSLSEKTDPMVEPMEIAEVQGNKIWSKQAAENIKDKIFGKTYKRERKSNPHATWRDTIPITKKEEVTADKGLNNSSHDGRKRKRKTAHVLQPEDFIRKKDPEADGSPSTGPPTSVNWCLGDAEKRCDESAAVESQLSGDREHNTLAEHEEGRGWVQKTAAEKVAGRQGDGELELSNWEQRSTKKRASAAKRCRSSTRTMCALQLVDRNSVSPDAAEPEIDSYPSSQEHKRGAAEQGRLRRSRRLQLLSGELAKGAGKGGGTKGVRNSESDDGGSVSGVQRNVLVHASEGKEPQSALSCKPLADLKAGGLEPKETPAGLKGSADTADPGKGLHDPTTSCQHSSCSSFAPDAGSQEGSPLLEPPSATVVQTASHPTEEMAEACAAAPQGGGHDLQSVPRDFQTEKLPVAKSASELTKEAEDSEVDTQYLRRIFRHSKRLSFSLYPTPRKVCAAEDAASETLKGLCADQVENKHSKYLKPEDLQEEKTAAESLSRVCEREKLKTCESACVSPVSSFVGTAERVHTGEQQRGAAGVANQGSLTPVRMGAAGTAEKTRLRNEKSASPDIGSELRQDPTDSNRSHSDDSGTEEQVFLRADFNAVSEAYFSSESSQAGKAKAADGKQDFQSKSMSKRARKQVKGNEEQATQTASIGMPGCSVTEALKEPLQEISESTGSSETVEGLLCSDDDAEENTSFSETHRRETSAVFVKGSDITLVKEPHTADVSSQLRSQGIGRSRRRAQKLQSSDEESSEEEDLPSFQQLIFGTSVRTPLQVGKPVTSVVESSVRPITLPHDGIHDDNNRQKMPEAALSSRHVSPSQESECSVNLFSSQSDESAPSLQELKAPSLQVHAPKQVSNANGSKEASQSSGGGLKRSKANSKNECQEDPNMGTNLGEASGDESETSNAEDTCGAFSQGEILTTQQKNAMQKNLQKLQKEMAVLEAVLKQHGSQDSEFTPVHGTPPPSSGEGTLGMEQRRQEQGK